VLEAAGHRVEYREYNGGHNQPAWRDDVWRGLEWLYR
jgi:enterochelin esterase family protein